jgi:poly [ADP-ribose] polymerase
LGAKAWKHNDPTQPKYPDDFEIAKKAVLQVTDIKNNNNKYYAIELHQSPKGFRVFTHYGRTDDLETNPNAGMRESRYFDTLGEAQREYDKIFREKTGPAKGYKEVSLASSKIGSHKARGQSSGEVDAKTLEKMKGPPGAAPAAPPPSKLPPVIQDFVSYVYSEATEALTTTVAAKITAHGIETPLGVLTVGQIEKGERILDDLYKLFNSGKFTAKQMEDGSGDFYSAIPHRLGRTREAISSAVIDSLAEFNQKQETLQLMKDMLAVNGEKGSVLFDTQLDNKYEALGCEVAFLDPKSSGFKELEDYVVKSQIKSKNVQVQNIYTLKRHNEHKAFDTKVGNEKMLFHGSRIKNWVGILSRGILMPKIVVSMGVNRTDAGWLGNGMYFGDAACTASFYTTPGKKKTRLMAVARVALGKMKDYTKITYGLNAPPAGFDSTHGVRANKLTKSEFQDDEYVIYDNKQQRLEYLVEFKA